jgi:hypothetical protein
LLYAVGLFQYSKSVWSKVGTHCLYAHKLFVNAWSGKSCTMYAIFAMFSSSEEYFQHF